MVVPLTPNVNGAIIIWQGAVGIGDAPVSSNDHCNMSRDIGVSPFLDVQGRENSGMGQERALALCRGGLSNPFIGYLTYYFIQILK
ncbi:hypothetical protein LQ318_06815 [Aliifodinibius salicampi]|uniref:Uncharacterized protein n=1 Tax=Fodinibius salicampi TaxID=1920655 RepID=A0ABT3PXM6_9BACT|nr:hypothetical protein [Fodinibius salicampi]MCW9712610.1 hypothetical protein [Fodinibius salicampi]